MDRRDADLAIAPARQIGARGVLRGDAVIAKGFRRTLRQAECAGAGPGREVQVLGPREAAHHGGIEDVAGYERERGDRPGNTIEAGVQGNGTGPDGCGHGGCGPAME